MATSTDGAHWGSVRLEELVRLFAVHNDVSLKKRQTFREKLGALKERQESLQSRRVSNLRKQGLHIDMNELKQRAKQPKGALHWFDDTGKNTDDMAAVNHRLKEMFSLQRSEIELDAGSVVDYESEHDAEDEQKTESRPENSTKQQTQPSSQILIREPTQLDLIKEDTLCNGNSAENTDTSRGKKRNVKHSKKSFKSAATIVKTAKYLHKLPKKKGKKPKQDH